MYIKHTDPVRPPEV